MQAIMYAETPEVQKLWQACEECMDDQFISTATENGVARREKMLNITPFASDTLDDRRFRLMSRYAENAPYTRRRLANMLASLCGEDGYTLTFGPLTVNVEVALTVRNNYKDVEDLLERVIPANMVINLTLKYNKHSAITSFTHEELQAFTHEELRNGVM